MQDNPQSYGTVSRLFHWLMAAMFAFMSVSAYLFTVDDEYFSLMPYHKATGFFLAVLVVLRLLWALKNAARRPHGSLIVKLGHAALYALMIAVPFIGLIRQYGGGRGPLEIGGVTVFPAAPEKIQWMSELGNHWHGLLGWALFALVAGHILMAVVHQLKGEKILNRMAGPR
ncbi:cytochrome b [Neisseria chenwenguii]|uniref:Cytochrome B n=1 Tax=Neisseria chenwenguii TaxID=1853278 RepID=A0A220S3X0_9NEIS|nr:cytochrome b/b6 domain-containing protein [Neisseria chenwenguii]ASK28033.1 cytochrome B [Neisseria chenwenguii]ROV57184.1 cytochrome b [Neisseria chenwenguii]